jgi:hypothetical protein
MEEFKLAEIKHGRLAMLAMAGGCGVVGAGLVGAGVVGAGVVGAGVVGAGSLGLWGQGGQGLPDEGSWPRTCNTLACPACARARGCLLLGARLTSCCACFVGAGFGAQAVLTRAGPWANLVDHMASPLANNVLTSLQQPMGGVAKTALVVTSALVGAVAAAALPSISDLASRRQATSE